jgi:hypothetical protein
MNLTNSLLTILVSVLSFSVFAITKDQITIEAYDAIYANALTSAKGSCLSFDVDTSKNDYFLLTVRENHTNPGCNGDNDVSTRMFDIRINKSDRSIYTNQGNNPDNFRKLPNNNERCVAINNDAEGELSKTPSSESVYVVTDINHVYFYSAPNEVCKIKDLFIIKGDTVKLQAEHKGFSSVVFFKKDGESVSGWIHSKSIKSTVTGVGAEGSK